MTREIEFRPEARDELEQAHDWYDDRRPGLGEQFMLAFEATLGRVRRLPKSHPVVHREMRRALLDRFPYGIVYIVDTDRIVVLAVHHVRRDPDEWKDRSD